MQGAPCAPIQACGKGLGAWDAPYESEAGFLR